MRGEHESFDADSPASHIDILIVQMIEELCLCCIYEYENDLVDFGMKRQNSFDVPNPAGSGRIDGNPAGSDRIEIGAGLQSLAPMLIPLADMKTKQLLLILTEMQDGGVKGLL
ncbi:hypothetical protein AVEN_166666-1 [Araneus ventricosus]|uniref:Uncharacterized protein n=1 Tax=Araneus ventricosus TaxID=182803 RepID=A0A4Y2JQK8_ARAVE|nr:hypothetical protein AVEN_166666-1 [Araneus ventricosus]